MTGNHKDLTMYNNYIKEYPTTIELKGLGCPKGTYINSYTTCYHRSLVDEAFYGYGKIKDMPYPYWLLPQPRVLAPSQLDVLASASSAPSSIGSSISILEHAVVESSLDIEQSILVPSEPFPLMAAPMSQPSDLAFDGPATAPMSQLSDAVSVVPVQPLSQPSLSRTVPRQVQQATTTQQDDTSLKGRRQLFIDTVFDVRSYNAITFGEFKSFWKGLHGKDSVIENTGSSHKKLIAGSQTFGIFAHGDGMRYTKNTIKYLRDALRDTGYGPTN